jgi:Flp pilus assembly protein TadD
MADQPALAEFKEGIRLLRDGHPADAYEYFRRASELDKQNPYYLSFTGLSVSRARQKWVDPVALCETALSLKRNETQLYLNLAEVYESARRQDDAVLVLEKGLIYCKGDNRIARARANLGRRRPPVLPSLDRGHFLNRTLGKLRHRVSGSLRKSEN